MIADPISEFFALARIWSVVLVIFGVIVAIVISLSCKPQKGLFVSIIVNLLLSVLSLYFYTESPIYLLTNPIISLFFNTATLVFSFFGFPQAVILLIDTFFNKNANAKWWFKLLILFYLLSTVLIALSWIRIFYISN